MQMVQRFRSQEVKSCVMLHWPRDVMCFLYVDVVGACHDDKLQVGVEIVFLIVCCVIIQQIGLEKHSEEGVTIEA